MEIIQLAAELTEEVNQTMSENEKTLLEVMDRRIS